jgi:hypothetical protein
MVDIKAFKNMTVSKQTLATIFAIILIAAGFGLRMIDLTNPPLDFHPSRQLFSYTIARGLFYSLH